jgi:signal transduction histidine kinase
MQAYGGALGERRLLLVEDDGELRSSLCDLLRSDGYDVADAANGSEALDYLRSKPAPDLILLDLMMPVKDGWQFRIEQKKDPKIAGIPVLAMSADDTPKAAAVDAEAYIKKPFDYEALCGTIRRIIEEKKLAHLDRMASLGTLAAGIAHEINNPLTYVIANLQLLEQELPESFRVHDALEGAERIRGIVSHMKTFSRAGEEHRTYVDIRSILDSSIKVVMSEIRERARLVKNYAHVPLVLANPGQLGQVFLNLLLNAAHAIEEGNPQKNTIRVTTAAGPSGDVVVEISDTGRGIPLEVRHRIFDPFFTTKPLGLGTGLGLSICHGIVRTLKGSISVESEVGKGSTFRVTLPASEQRPVAAAKHNPLPIPQHRGKILIVDDEPRLAQVVKDMIGNDHETSVVTTGTDALQLLMQEPDDGRFDLILCDLHMPEISGMDLHQKLVEIRPAVAERMVFMTGGAFTERSRDFVSKVGNACIDKPIDVGQLKHLVTSTLVRRQS